jgi:Tol biopolymer transport system component
MNVHAGGSERRATRLLVAWFVAAGSAGALLAETPADAAEAPSGRTAPHAQIVFSRATSAPESDYEIMTMDRAGGHQRQLTWNDGADHDPAWSPDGERIAWARYRSPANTGPSEVWVMDADGSDKRQLTHVAGHIVSPTWSPDGTRIAFEDRTRIWVMDADGTDLHPISPEGAFDRQPDWSPDGRWILFSSVGAITYDLFAMRPDGSDRRLVAATPGSHDEDPAWSPDGHRIAYTSDKGSRGTHVGAMRADGKGHHVVVTDAREPDWTPAGRLVFEACVGVGCPLHTSSYRGEGVTTVGDRGHYDVSPDVRPRARR